MHVDFARQTRAYAGLYEIELNRHLRRLLKPGVSAFDVGAQHGYDSLVIANLTRAPVAAFECDADCLTGMHESFALNPDLAPLIRAVGGMVGYDLSLDDWAYGDGFVPGFIKLDIEGGELVALRSAERLLREQHPALVVEVHSASLEQDCGRLMTELGYRPTIVNPRRWLPDHRPGLELNRWLVAAA
jgi:Methyltransferase FkbM domain